MLQIRLLAAGVCALDQFHDPGGAAPVLLIDEIDHADEERSLLEFLSDFPSPSPNSALPPAMMRRLLIALFSH